VHSGDSEAGEVLRRVIAPRNNYVRLQPEHKVTFVSWQMWHNNTHPPSPMLNIVEIQSSEHLAMVCCDDLQRPKQSFAQGRGERNP
jgi:hypothetical protein